MHITFISPAVSMSGGTKVIGIYSQELSRRGHLVRVVSTPPERMPFRRKVKSLLRGRGWPRDPLAQKSHLDGSGIDHRVLNRWRPIEDRDVPDADVVIATWWETAEWVSRLSFRKGVKVYFVQGHEIFPHLPIRRCRATYRLPMHKIVVSGWLKEIMNREYGDTVVDCVPNSVDRSQFFATPRSKQPVPTVGFLYSSAQVKGLDLMLAAIDKLRGRFPDLRLLSFGSEYPSPGIPLPAGTEFFHLPTPDRIRELYSQCDVWVSGSRNEGFNLPAMEAMACRTPVVTTKTGWPAEALHCGRNGVLVDVEDVAGLARAIDWVLSLPEAQWQTLSLSAHDTVGTASWQASAEQFELALMHACRRSLAGQIEGHCSEALTAILRATPSVERPTL